MHLSSLLQPKKILSKQLLSPQQEVRRRKLNLQPKIQQGNPGKVGSKGKKRRSGVAKISTYPLSEEPYSSDWLGLSKTGLPQAPRMMDIILEGAIIMDSATKTVDGVDVACLALTF